MTGVSMSGIVFRPECTWTSETLAFAALLWSWSDEKTLIERFTTARKIIIDRYAEQPEPAGSYQAFTKMLCKWTEALRTTLSTAFRQRMAQTLAAVWKVEGWLVFAVDGSRVDPNAEVTFLVEYGDAASRQAGNAALDAILRELGL